MAEVIGAAILSAIGTTAAEVAAAASAATTLTITASAVASTVGTLAITGATIGLSLALQPGLPKPESGHAPVKQAISPRQFAFGRVRISGPYACYEERNGQSYDIVALNQGRVVGFANFYLHDDEVTLPGTLVTATVDTAINDGRYRQNVSIAWRFGAATETAYPNVTSGLPSVWTADHRGDGVASVMVECTGVKAADFQKVYPHGLPQPSAVIEGMPLWDPRDAGQDPDDPATWIDYPVWSSATTYAAGTRVLHEIPQTVAHRGYYGVFISRSNGNLNHAPDTSPSHWIPVFHNPVLQLINYITDTDHGMGLEREVLIDPVLSDWIAEANLCDALVEKADGSFEPRYASSGFATFDTNPEPVIGAILASCDGWLDESGDGTLVIKVGVYSDPTVTVEARHTVGFSVSYGTADEQTVNELTISYTSPPHGYKEAAGDPWRNEADITARGLRRSQGLSLLWVQSHSQSRRLAKRAMARLSAPLRGSFTTKLWGLRAVGHRWVRLQYPFIAGLEDAVVEIQKVGIDLLNGRVTFDWLLVDPDTIDVWDPDTEEGEAPPTPGLNASTELPVPENVAATPVGSPPFHIDVSWDDPDRPDVTWTVRYRLADDGSGNPGAWTDVPLTNLTSSGGRIFATIFPTTEDLYEIQIAAVGSRGTIGEYAPDPALLVLTDAGAVYDNTGTAGSGLLILDNAGEFIRDNS